MRLVPCPFCGSKMQSFSGMTEDAFAKCSEGGFSINCDCGVIGPTGQTMEDAVVRWNRREQDSATMTERRRCAGIARAHRHEKWRDPEVAEGTKEEIAETIETEEGV